MPINIHPDDHLHASLTDDDPLDFINDYEDSFFPGHRARGDGWMPAPGCLARVRFTTSGLRAGEVVYVEHVYGARCGNDACVSCERVSLVFLRVSAPEDEQEERESYQSVPIECLSPVAPAPPTGSALVRCDHPDHSGIHFYSLPECVAPYRMVSSNMDGRNYVDALRPAFRERWALELVDRENRRADMLRRASSMRIGDRYQINYTNSNYAGYVAAVREFPFAGNGVILCDVFDNYGCRIRNRARISVFDLGQRIVEWQFARQVPSFINWGIAPNIREAVTVTDREVNGDGDSHECDGRCFDYGCVDSQGSDYNDYDDDDEDSYEDESGVSIHSYSYRPNLVFYGRGPVFLGTELELSTGSGESGARAQSAAARLITEAMGERVYLKSDGSISGYGFEAVFHPMSYDWLVQNWPDDLLRNMRRVGAMPHSSCGMHVHVSRSGFSNPVHAYKWIKFMYRNERQMRALARRDPGEWGSFGRATERAAAKWYAKGGYGAENRYTAVNCVPRNTYEVRIFASTLNRTRFLGSLGLVDASVEYTRQVTTEQILKSGGWTFGPFREYVESFKKYAPLQKEMVRLLDK